MPKIMGDHSQLPMTMAIRDGTIRGLLLMNQNPVVGGHNSGMIREALPNLKWMAIRETFDKETASYWYKSPEAKTGLLKAKEIKTETLLLPAALPGEKNGSFTNTHRLVQWHDKVVEPPGDCRLFGARRRNNLRNPQRSRSAQGSQSGKEETRGHADPVEDPEKYLDKESERWLTEISRGTARRGPSGSRVCPAFLSGLVPRCR
ncbi:hypothetical protein [Desulfopila inferna]|uniref:hypothetical protein n=1 Tax=Desulfopila inferna TaxID=468528 RepID=UPI0019633FA0|nr:hypothetical protein [Desulfopila inferna]MBM9606074.1 hypothetical protein [Desulfopila inferna]